MSLDQPTGEGETQAGTLLPGIGLSDLREFVEDQFLIFRCDTGTSVGDAGFEDRIRSVDAEIKADSKEPRP